MHLVFDVNDTLLDVSALDAMFDRLFGDASLRTEWFYTLEENWLTATITDSYRNFGVLAKAALVMVGRRRGTVVETAEQERLIEQLKQLPPHSDVTEALSSLRDNGFQLTALSNGTLAALKQQLESAGLAAHMKSALSADEVQRYKPAPEAYQMTAQRLGVSTADMLMIAAHAWDISGAAAAGCHTAFVGRPGKVLNPASVQPDIEGDGLADVAQKIIAQYG